MGTGFTQFDCHNAKTLSCNTSIIDNNGTGCNNIVTGGYCGTNYNLYTAPEKVYINLRLPKIKTSLLR